MKIYRCPKKDKLQGCRSLKTLHFRHKPQNYVKDLPNRSDSAKPTEINIWRPITNTATVLILHTNQPNQQVTLSIKVLRYFIKQAQTSLIKLACQITSNNQSHLYFSTSCIYNGHICPTQVATFPFLLHSLPGPCISPAIYSYNFSLFSLRKLQVLR